MYKYVRGNQSAEPNYFGLRNSLTTDVSEMLRTLEVEITSKLEEHAAITKEHNELEAGVNEMKMRRDKLSSSVTSSGNDTYNTSSI